ncbi:MAG: molecular chaperone EcpD [Haliea sp.]|nr:molecular chaperone EcpD [Haliea sp.]|tara:strand:+ start:963 stop:1679 length:717 start_codon:yes stop_codon:yes gene_type:complete
MKISRYLAVLVVLVGLVNQVHAAVVISGTRVIYKAESSEQTIKLENKSDSPVLVQTWIDGESNNRRADEAESPFILSPPVFRLDSGKGQVLRVRQFTDIAEKEKESVFWLNVLEVPVVPEDGVNNYLQLAIKTRIKIFYRPKGLEGSPDTVPEKLKWTVEKQSDGVLIRCQNETAFSASLTEIVINAEGVEHRIDASMVMPGEIKDWYLGDVELSEVTGKKFGIINDYGSVMYFPMNP